MTDKLEVAKLATQLTTALLTDRDGRFAEVLRTSERATGNRETPDVVAVFDYLFEHIQARLSREN